MLVSKNQGANAIQDLLCAVNICDPTSIELYFPRVRDREDVKVLKCKKSGVIFLSRCDHIHESDYKERQDLAYWMDGDRNAALTSTAEDDRRRSEQFRSKIKGTVWLDFGTGLGGILDILKNDSSAVLAVEPQSGARKALENCGYEVYSDIAEVKRRDIDTVTLFHVLEHLTDPITELRQIRQIMKPGGSIIIEVPHARDALLNLYNNEAFKAFTFWSEHLILHTRDSLKVFLREAGFKNVAVTGFQRYPLPNHLYWLAQGKPGGQNIWKQLRSRDLETVYADVLNKIDQTDTLIAQAEA